MASGNVPGCIFCDIVAGRATASTVYEDEKTIAFLDLFPITRGHLLVVPKRHVDRLVDLPEEDYADVLRALARVCRRVERLSRHYNVGVNQGALAGQIVFHLHFHVIPRYDANNPFAGRARTRLTEDDAHAVAAELGAA
jgi:diadenosine tetraphosphate (Ap4A) HIT family hydrolase